MRIISATLSMSILDSCSAYVSTCRLITVEEMSSLNQYQDGQCTCDVTLRRVRATLVAVEKQLLHILSASVCVCVCV